jgi:hypothetical protein
MLTTDDAGRPPEAGASDGQTRRVAFSPEGRYLAVGLEDGTVAIVRVSAELAAR